MIATENQECENLIQWARLANWQGLPLSAYLVMIPNGNWLAGDKVQRAKMMARLKRRGFRSGASDYILAIPSANYHGLWIEMKRTKRSVTSEAQIDFLQLMAGQGYATAVCKGFAEAMAVIQKYLRGEM